MDAQGNSRPALTLDSFYHVQPHEESFFVFLPENMKSLTNSTSIAPKERNNSHFVMTRVHDVYYAINFSQLVSVGRDGQQRLYGGGRSNTTWYNPCGNTQAPE